MIELVRGTYAPMLTWVDETSKVEGHALKVAAYSRAWTITLQTELLFSKSDWINRVILPEGPQWSHSSSAVWIFDPWNMPQELPLADFLIFERLWPRWIEVYGAAMPRAPIQRTVVPPGATEIIPLSHYVSTNCTEFERKINLDSIAKTR